MLWYLRDCLWVIRWWSAKYWMIVAYSSADYLLIIERLFTEYCWILQVDSLRIISIYNSLTVNIHELFTKYCLIVRWLSFWGPIPNRHETASCRLGGSYCPPPPRSALACRHEEGEWGAAGRLAPATSRCPGLPHSHQSAWRGVISKAFPAPCSVSEFERSTAMARVLILQNSKLNQY